jgi:hypothetical protein
MQIWKDTYFHPACTRNTISFSSASGQFRMDRWFCHGLPTFLMAICAMVNAQAMDHHHLGNRILVMIIAVETTVALARASHPPIYVIIIQRLIMCGYMTWYMWLHNVKIMYIYMYICIYVYMYLNICIYLFIYICIYVYKNICVYVYMYLNICIYVYMYICICIYVYMYMNICIYVYIFKYVNMHICIYVYVYKYIHACL